MGYESVVVQNLILMRKNLLLVRENAKLCGFSYEVDDAISELIDIVEFGLDEIGEDFD